MEGKLGGNLAETGFAAGDTQATLAAKQRWRDCIYSIRDGKHTSAVSIIEGVDLKQLVTQSRMEFQVFCRVDIDIDKGSRIEAP